MAFIVHIHRAGIGFEAGSTTGPADQGSDGAEVELIAAQSAPAAAGQIGEGRAFDTDAIAGAGLDDGGAIGLREQSPAPLDPVKTAVLGVQLDHPGVHPLRSARSARFRPGSTGRIAGRCRPGWYPGRGLHHWKDLNQLETTDLVLRGRSPEAFCCRIPDAIAAITGQH